jgi:hypothetical protein
MPATLGPRFVLEAGFLILLAVVVGFADLKPALIILVMAIAWLLVALIEYFAWRQGPRVGAMRRFATAGEPPPVVQEEVVQEEVVQEEVVEEVAPPPPPPPPEPPPPEEETIIEPAPAAPGDLPPSESERPAEFLAQPQERARYSLEPLKPRPRRRWIVIGPRERPEAPAEGPREEER